MFNKIFSIKEKDFHYEIKLLGIKFKLKNSKKAFRELKRMKLELKRSEIPTIYLADLTKKQKEWFLSKKFYEEVGYFPNLKNPKSFNEKINWLKLNYSNPLEETCIDKYTFKSYIDEKLGKGYVIPALGVWEDVNDIDFDLLPNRFVIKSTTSGSNEGVEVVKNKNNLNIDRIKYKFNNLLQDWNTIYYYCLSRGYKAIKPRILIEEYVEQLNGQLYDYKFMCFSGTPRWVLVCADRGKNTIYENHDMDWNLMVPSNNSAKKSKINPPKNFEKMIEIARELSKPFPFVRVDFYEVEGKIYVGELTFTPNGGFNTYKCEWDNKFGDWLDLDSINPEFLVK